MIFFFCLTAKFLSADIVLRLNVEGKFSLSDLDSIYKHEVLKYCEIKFWDLMCTIINS